MEQTLTRGRFAWPLYRNLSPKSSQFGTPWPTRLDKIKNFHSLDSIATETYGTHGRSIRVHPS